MPPRIVAMVASVLLAASATPMTAQTPPAPVPAADLFDGPWTPARTAQFDLGPAAAPFRILVSLPEAPPPPEGYGVVYALDAGWTFGTLRDSVLMQTGPYAGNGSAPTVVVGIGWPTETLADFDRRGPDLVGDRRAAMLTFIAEELIPRVEGRLSIDPAHRMLAGHSFGGAFALQARIDRPGLFSHIAAGSPSIWTDPEGFFAGASPDGPPVLITVGGLEAPEAAEAAGTPADRVARLRERDMTGRAARMAKALPGAFEVFPDASHGASVTPFLARAVQFLWTRP